MPDKDIIWSASISAHRKGHASQARDNDAAADNLKNQDGIYAGELRALADLRRAILVLINENDAAWKERREKITG